MMKRIILSCLISIYAFGLSAKTEKVVAETKNAPWMDSVIAEGVRKISEANFYLRHPELKKKADPFQELNLGSFMIVIDAAKWTPNLVPEVYSYQKTGTGPWTGPDNALRDSIRSYNNQHIQNPSNYVAYFNIVINNFPLELSKDVSTVGNNSNLIMFTQLQQLKAIENEPYSQATACFDRIINNIAVLAAQLPGLDDVVILGSANMLGQYGNKDQMRASYLAQEIVIINIDTNLPWVGQLGRIPDFFKVPFVQLVPPTLAERNAQVALAVRNFLDCNVYAYCRPDNTIFTSPYAQWLYGNLVGNANIDQTKLMNTALLLNGLTNEFAWAVLTVEYETGYDQYVSTPLGPIYNAFTNATLDRIAFLTPKIQRAEWSLKNDGSILRDSALYYGWLLYRVPSYISGISTAQRVHLLDAITHASCPDINGAFDAMDYEKHCERVCKSLYTYLSPGEQRNFIEQLKSSGVIWNLSYRLDNSTLGFFGKDNYTDFIFTLSVYWKQAYPALAVPDTNNRPESFHVVKWESSFINSNGKVTTNHSANTLTMFQMSRAGSVFNITTASYTVDIYDPIMISVKEGSLLPDLPGVKELVVPAIFLDWLYHKKTLDDIGTATHVAVNVVALATGVGEFYHATSMSMRVIAGLEVAITAGDLVMMDTTARNVIKSCFDTPEKGAEFIAWYEKISMAVNFTIAAKGLIYGFDNTVNNFCTKFDEKEAQLKTNLGEQSAEYKGMKKIRQEGGPLTSLLNKGDLFYASANDLARTYDVQLSLPQSVRNQIYELYVSRNWGDLESYFISHQINQVNGVSFPPGYGGFNTRTVSLKKGMIFDRYQESITLIGTDPLLRGSFTSAVPNGTPYSYSSRALHVLENENALYYKIEVLQDLPFTGEEADIIPWFGKSGMGQQTKFNIPKNPETNFPYTWNEMAAKGWVKVTISHSPNGVYSNFTGLVISN